MCVCVSVYVRVCVCVYVCARVTSDRYSALTFVTQLLSVSVVECFTVRMLFERSAVTRMLVERSAVTRMLVETSAVTRVLVEMSAVLDECMLCF